MKQVEYQGKQYEAPDWAEFICADGNDEVWCYEYKPYWNSSLQKYDHNDGRARRAELITEGPEIKRI